MPNTNPMWFDVHDATLLKVNFDWVSHSVAIHVRTHDQGEVVLFGVDMTYMEVPSRAPWGPSVSINEIRGPLPAGLEQQRMEIHMQSGDVLILEGSEFRL